MLMIECKRATHLVLFKQMPPRKKKKISTLKLIKGTANFEQKNDVVAALLRLAPPNFL